MANSSHKANDVYDFPPYAKFDQNRDALTKHLCATGLAYGIAVASLADTAIECEPTSDPAFVAVKSDSFTKADLHIKDAQRVFGWIDLEEYAKLEKKELASVEADARAGLLGTIVKCPKKDCDLVLWPVHMQGSEDAKSLKIGESSWSIEATRRATETVKFDTDDTTSLRIIRSHLLFTARKLGEPTAVYSEAKELMLRSTFLSLWSIFEVFIRETFGELILKFPVALGKLPGGKKANISYEYLVEKTYGLLNLQPLIQNILALEIARTEAGGEGIHGLINLLKSTFRWENDLYSHGYKEHGVKLMTTYSDLLEIKEVRNVLIHNSTLKGDAIYNKSERLAVDSNRIAIDENYVEWAELVLSAIAYGIAEEISKDMVNVS